MDIHNCQFCGHGNAADAKYCSECGGCLYLVPCPDCGVVNDVKARSCYQCQRPLQGGSAGTMAGASPVAVMTPSAGPDLLTRALDVGKLEPALPLPPATTVTTPLWRKHGLAIGVAAVVALAALGYYGYRQQMFPVAATSPAAGGTPGVRATPASAGVIRGEGATVPAAAGAAAGASAEASAAVNAVTPPPAVADPPKATKTETARKDACNDAAAALGLCEAANAVAAPPAVTHTLRKE